MIYKDIIKKDYFAIAIILILSAVVRFWGIHFGLPNVECRPDESNLVKIMLNFFKGDFNPHWFLYPSLFFYLSYILNKSYFLLGYITNYYSSLNDFLMESYHNPIFYMVNRTFSAIIGTATVFVTYRIALKLYGRMTAWIAALFLGLAYLHVRDSHFGVTDVPTVFFIMCSILFIIKEYENDSIKNIIVAGIYAGLATSTKFIGIMLVVPMFITIVVSDHENVWNKLSLYLNKKIILFIVVLVIVFFIGTPFAILDYHKFISDTYLQWWIVNHGMGNVVGRGWWYHLKFSLFYGLGWSLFIISLVGIIISFKKDLKKAIILLSFPLVYYAIGFKGFSAVFARYALPLIPFLCVTGAVSVVFIGERLARYVHGYLNHAAIFLIALLVILPSTYNLIEFNKMISRIDNRVIAAKWSLDNLTENERVVQIGSPWGRVDLLGRFIEGIYDDKSKRIRYLNGNYDALPRYMIVQSYPLKIWNKIPNEINEILKRHYSLIKSFKVIDIHNKANVYDQVDAFYLPFAGFKSIERSGPNINIYEINSQSTRKE